MDLEELLIITLTTNCRRKKPIFKMAWLDFFDAKEGFDSTCSTSFFMINSQLNLTDLCKALLSRDTTELSNIEKVRLC